MPRARGSNVAIAAATETTYGVVPATGFTKLPIVSETLGNERTLIASDLLGFGREPLDPTYDVINNAGDVVVPVDVRSIGHWLRLLMGPPVTTGKGVAQGGWSFPAQPAVGSTIGVNGYVFTFVAGGATGPQINIGADVATTVANAVAVLNASAVTPVTFATYSSIGSTLIATLALAGAAGNGFLLAASASSNATINGVTRNLVGWGFSAQPQPGSTISVNGTPFAFVNVFTAPNQIMIGGNLNVTLANAVAALNASSVPGVALANYYILGFAFIAILKPGVDPTTFTAASSVTPPSNAAPTAATAAPFTTVSGGTNAHIFTSGALALPSMSLEVGYTDIGSFAMQFGLRANQMKIALSRSGLLNATVSLIAQGESPPAAASVAGTPTVETITRFAQATGSITRDGVQLASVVTADLTYSNNLEKVESIRTDGMIEDADPGMVMVSGSLTTRYADNVLYSQAVNGLPVQLSYGWAIDIYSLTFAMPRVFLPVPKRSISGPNGIQVAYNWEASGAAASSCTARLVNEVPTYA